MAKKTKELEPNEVTEVKKKTTTKKTTANSTAAKKPSTKKNTTAKKSATTSKKATKKKSSSTVKKASTVKKTTATKSATKATKKATAKATKKPTTSSKKTATKAKTTRKKSTSTKTRAVELPFKSEYYDLPYMYNNTVVKVLAQTPKMLFIYWEISEEDRNNLENMYGQDFFEKTRPVLIVYNDTMHYSFEVDINDFANSWYLHIDDANCDYHIELGRRPYPYIFPSNNSEPVYIPHYIYLTSSNKMTSPNNRILFDPSLKTVRFRNVKTGQIIDKDISQFTFITNFGIFRIKDLYEFLFPGESFEYENIVLGHTSSGALSSSGMFSSQFK